ncbi:MAG: hypothetical protein RPU91_17930 [Candidatus Sedimenticola sp. (ex Thyasira tokunagai)]
MDAQISFGDGAASIQRSKLFSSIREILKDNGAQPTLKDEAGEVWQLELVDKDNKCLIALSHGEHRRFLPDCSALSPDQTMRLNGFEREIEEVNLPKQAVTNWREVLSSGALPDDELVALHAEIKETPIRVAALVRSEIEKGKSSLPSLVPRSERYFDRLVGDCQQSLSITEYARTGARKHIDQLMSWRVYDGFLLSLLLSSHSLNLSAIEIAQIEEDSLIQAYEWLQSSGDRVSQLGAIEIGLSIMGRQPKIEPLVKDMIEQIRDDNVDGKQSRFQLLSALIIFVEGELAYTRVLREKPPFWRRLASIAQASLIEREIIGQAVDIAGFSRWTIQIGGQSFYLQTMVDLYREPRWHPDLVSPQQLKSEFIGRIINAANQNESSINAPAIRELLFGKTPESLQSLVEFPFPYLPGPLEGGIESQNEPPADIVSVIEERLSEDVLQPNSFAALVNSALIFRLDSYHAQLAAKALRAVKHQLRQAGDKEQLLSVLRGLATVAAVTRSNELAEELRMLTRRCQHEAGYNLSSEEAMQIGLIAAAAHSELAGWCEFVGEWITELAFRSLEFDEMLKLHSHVEQLCHIVPELWRTCGRAEAALSSVVSTRANPQT